MLDLEPIERRLNAAGKKPWKYIHSPGINHPHTIAEMHDAVSWTNAFAYDCESHKANAVFAAEAKQDVPALLAEVLALREERVEACKLLIEAVQVVPLSAGTEAVVNARRQWSEWYERRNEFLARTEWRETPGEQEKDDEQRV